MGKRNSVSKPRFSCPLLMIAFGESAESVLQRVLDCTRSLAKGRFPYHFGFAAFRPSISGMELKYVDRTVSDQTADGKDIAVLDRVWSAGNVLHDADPEESPDLSATFPELNRDAADALGLQLIGKAAALASQSRLDEAERRGMDYRADKADVAVVIDTADTFAWNWALPVALRMRQNGHRVIGYVLHRLDDGESALNEIQSFADDLEQDQACFSQLYLVSNRNQAEGEVNRIEREQSVAMALVDRNWEESAERFRNSIDQRMWVAKKDSPANHLWSFASRTLSLDPEEYIDLLVAEEYRELLGDPQWPDPSPKELEINGNDLAKTEFRQPPASRLENPKRVVALMEAAQLALQPKPGSLDASKEDRSPSSKSRPESNSVGWPAIDEQEVARRIHTLENELWGDVEQQLQSRVPRMEVSHRIMAEAEAEVKAVVQRFRINAESADRQIKEAFLQPPTKTVYRRRQVRAPVSAGTLIVVLVLVLAAFVFSLAIARVPLLQTVSGLTTSTVDAATTEGLDGESAGDPFSLKSVVPFLSLGLVLLAVVTLGFLIQAILAAIEAAYRLLIDRDIQSGESERAPLKQDSRRSIFLWSSLIIGVAAILLGWLSFRTNLSGLGGQLKTALVYLSHGELIPFSSGPLSLEQRLAPLALLPLILLLAMVWGRLSEDQRLAHDAPVELKGGTQRMRSAIKRLLTILQLGVIFAVLLPFGPELLLIALSGVVLVLAFLLLKPREAIANVASEVVLPTPYDMKLIHATRAQFGKLLHRIGASRRRLFDIARSWQARLQSQVDAAGDSNMHFQLLDESAIQRLRDEVRSTSHVNEIDQIARRFPTLISQTVRGGGSVDDIFCGMDDEIHHAYRRLKEMDMQQLLAVLGHDVDSLISRMGARISAAWPLPDAMNITAPTFIAVDTPVGVGKTAPDGEPRSIRLYKFCQGVENSKRFANKNPMEANR